VIVERLVMTRLKLSQIRFNSPIPRQADSYQIPEAGSAQRCASASHASKVRGTDAGNNQRRFQRPRPRGWCAQDAHDVQARARGDGPPPSRGSGTGPLGEVVYREVRREREGLASLVAEDGSADVARLLLASEAAEPS
jgi:hypothetical protein